MAEKDIRDGRQSNWELMRIFAMLMIVLGHFIGQGEFLRYAKGIDFYLGGYLANFGRISVNLFLFLGIWFMVDSKFKVKRITQLYFQVWTFTALITACIISLGYSVPTNDIIKGFLPFLGRAVWFASSYLALLLISPWLNKIFELKHESLKNLVIVLFILINLWVTFWSFAIIWDGWLDCFVWFTFSYIFIGYYKKYMNLKYNKYLVLSIGIVLYFLLVTINQYCMLNMASSIILTFIHKSCNAFLSDYKTFPNLFIAMCFFYFFQNLNIGVNKVINYIATGAFTTYIIHQTPVFIHVLWFNIYSCEVYFQKSYKFTYIMFVVLSIYIFCLFMERIRKKVVEKYLLNLGIIKFIENKLDLFYQKVI